MRDRIPRLAKMLASDSPKTRKLGFKFACELLRMTPSTDSPELTYSEVLGICKGLYYSLWMQDKLLLQEDTCARIVRLLPVISLPERRNNFVTAMFETLAREWDNLDVWRTDKFLMLVRDFFVKALLIIRRRHLSNKAFAKAIFDKVLNADFRVAVDLKVHMCSVIKEELKGKKDLSRVIHNFFRRTLFVIIKIPRGSDYCTQLIQLLLALAKLIRSDRSLPREELSETVLKLSGKALPHKKTLLRISKILYVGQRRVSTNKGALPTSVEVPSKINRRQRGEAINKQRIRKKVLSNPVMLDAPANEDSSQLVEDPNDDDVSTFQNTQRKRSHPEEDIQSQDSTDEKVVISDQILSADIHNSSSISPPAKKRRRRNKKPKKTSDANQCIPSIKNCVSIIKPEEIITPQSTEWGISSHVKLSSSSVLPVPASLLTDKSVSGVEDCRTTEDSLTEDLVPSKKRVSFGKVFRKRFLSNRILTSKSTNLTTIPNRGILRH